MSDQPKIPDGGLQHAMPEWLRKPPAWKERQPATKARQVDITPDRSEIDPSSLVSVEDLPQWLQEIALRSVQEDPGPAAEVPDSADVHIEHQDAVSTMPQSQAVPPTPQVVNLNTITVAGLILFIVVCALIVFLLLQ